MAAYQLLTDIQIQQIPTPEYPTRNWLLKFSFLSKYEGYSCWDDLTQTLVITLPKRVNVRAYRVETDPFTFRQTTKSDFYRLGNTDTKDSNLGGFQSPPTLLRGDLIRFNVGYRAIVNGGETTYMSGQNNRPHLFEGVISSVQPKFPFTIECEDYMWLLKQVPTPAKQWPKKTLQDIVSEVLAENADHPVFSRYRGYVNLRVSDFSKTDLKFNVNNFTTTRGTLAMMLARIKSDYRVDSYFRGQELRIGYTHYVPADSEPPYKKFTFQKNIIDDNLQWRRKDDVILSMIVRSNYLVETTGVTNDGFQKTKHAATEILILNEAGKFIYVVKEKGKDFPTRYLNDIGQRYTFNIYDVITDPAKLFEIGVAQLQKQYYDGFKGSFITFAIPHVRHGDTIEIENKQMPEMSGFYKVRGVRSFGGFDDGGRQEITIDYRVDK